MRQEFEPNPPALDVLSQSSCERLLTSCWLVADHERANVFGTGGVAPKMVRNVPESLVMSPRVDGNTRSDQTVLMKIPIITRDRRYGIDNDAYSISPVANNSLISGISYYKLPTIDTITIHKRVNMLLLKRTKSYRAKVHESLFHECPSYRTRSAQLVRLYDRPDDHCRRLV